MMLTMADPFPIIGAPLVSGFEAPPEDTPGGDFYRWMQRRRGSVQDIMTCLWHRWTPVGCFVEVNFQHREFGPAGAIVMTVGSPPDKASCHRVRRVMAIPLAELASYLPSWSRGETLSIETDTMPDPLRRRYSLSPIRWSLNVPIHFDGSWVGLIGAGLAHQPAREMVEAFEASARLIVNESIADRAMSGFRALVATSARSLTKLSIVGTEFGH